LISLGVIGLTALVVTQYKAAVASLSEKADLLELTHDTVFSRTIDDVITFWNNASEQMYGWARGEAVGKVSHELLQPTFPKPLDWIKAEVARAGRWEGEAVYRKRDGTAIAVNSRWALQRDRHGRPTLILETNTDITERKRAEDQLRDSEARFQAWGVAGRPSATTTRPFASTISTASSIRGGLASKARSSTAPRIATTRPRPAHLRLGFAPQSGRSEFCTRRRARKAGCRRGCAVSHLD